MSSTYFTTQGHSHLNNTPMLAEANEPLSSEYFIKHFNIVITAATIALVVSGITIIYFLSRRVCSICCYSSSERKKVKEAYKNYVPDACEEALTHQERNYETQPGSQDGLNHIIEIPSNVSDNQSIRNDSEYDNLSLNPTFGDDDVLDEVPEYEQPPSYRSH